MTSQKIAAAKTFSPAIDNEAHQKTYRGFVRFVEISTVVVVCWVLSLAIGGYREAWSTAVFGVVISAIAGTIGAFRPSIGVRAPIFVAFVLALLLLFH